MRRSFKWHHLMRMHAFWCVLGIAIVILAIVLSASLKSRNSVVFEPSISGPVQGPELPIVPAKPKPVLVPIPRAGISSAIVPMITKGTAVVTSASPAVFAYAHGTTQAGDKFIVGTADRVGNQYPSNTVLMFTDPSFIDRYVTILLPRNGDVETMVYDQASNKVYFLLTDVKDFELYSFDVSTLYLYEVASSTTLNPGQKPAIVTDGTYVYGITNTSPSTIFKVKISDGTITVDSKGHISQGHSAAIGIYPNKTELYFGGGMSDEFEKVDAATLQSLGKVNVSPCAETDDLPFDRLNDQSGYLYVGCEIQPYGYRINTANLSLDRFLLPGSSLGLFIFGNDLYNAAQDGNIDIFPNKNLGILQRFYIASSSFINNHSQDVEPNELFYSNTTGNLYFTAWWGIPGLFAVSTTTAPVTSLSTTTSTLIGTSTATTTP